MCVWSQTPAVIKEPNSGPSATVSGRKAEAQEYTPAYGTSYGYIYGSESKPSGM